jgi:hypothetical protein
MARWLCFSWDNKGVGDQKRFESWCNDLFSYAENFSIAENFTSHHSRAPCGAAPSSINVKSHQSRVSHQSHTHKTHLRRGAWRVADES